MTDYTPNFGDPRVEKRIVHALGMSLAVLSPTVPQTVGSKLIKKHFGQGQHPLGKYLRSTLLVTTDDHYDSRSGKCQQHIVSMEGATKLAKAIGRTKGKLTQQSISDIVVEWATDKFGDEMKNGFEYSDKAHRLWHPLQNVKRELRDDYFTKNGYKYKYDISTTAQTILYQYAIKHSEKALELPCISFYITNKDSVRTRLSDDLGIPKDETKRLITAITSGAYISTKPMTTVYDILGGDINKINTAKENVFLTAYRADLTKLWKVIKDSTETSGRKMSAKDKWYLYFQEERKVLDAIRNTYDNLFLVHDGFYSKQQLTTKQLTDLVLSTTGYKLFFDMDIL